MKAQDVIKQLCGEVDSCSSNRAYLAFVYYKPEKHPEFDAVYINFETGAFTLQKFDDGGSTIEEKKFAIKATLEPLDEPLED